MKNELYNAMIDLMGSDYDGCLHFLEDAENLGFSQEEIYEAKEELLKEIKN